MPLNFNKVLRTPWGDICPPSNYCFKCMLTGIYESCIGCEFLKGIEDGKIIDMGDENDNQKYNQGCN